MSKGIRRPVMKSPFEAKRVIVAGCAAIAMVLGAMSVGTSFIRSGDTSGSSQVSAIINSDTPPRERKPAVTEFSRQHTMEVRDFLQQQSAPLYTTPVVTSKSTRKSISPVFSSVSPFFLNSINQLPLDLALPSGTTSSVGNDKDAGSDTSASKSTPEDSTSTAESGDTSSDTAASDAATEETPSKNDDTPQTTMRSQSVEQTTTVE